jgi:hypothetical protein
VFAPLIKRAPFLDLFHQTLLAGGGIPSLYISLMDGHGHSKQVLYAFTYIQYFDE